MENVIVREYERVYNIVCRAVNKQNYKVEFKNLINVKIFKVKNKNDKSQIFLKAGKMFAILTALDITEVFFKGMVISKDKLVIDFSFINLNKIDKRNKEIMTSVDICNEILDCLCYREENLYNNETCDDFIKYLKNGWKTYGELFMYSYRKTYRLISFNKILFNNIEESELSIKDKVLNSIYKFNKYDLSFKSRIIEIEFDERKNKSFKLKSKTIKQLKNRNDLIAEVEHISDIITQESILGIDNSNILRSFIGNKIDENNEITFDILDFDYKSGVSGIVYFYLKLFELTKNRYYFKLAIESLGVYSSDININKNEITFILKHMYELSGEEKYKNLYLKNKLADSEIKAEECKFKNRSSYSCIVFKNSLNKYFLGIDNGLAGYGLYIINLISSKENVVIESNDNVYTK
ncbi:MAG: hypothetical protein ACRDA5_07540 [Clostridium sp.]